jgi:hypothetical protein
MLTVSIVSGLWYVLKPDASSSWKQVGGTNHKVVTRFNVSNSRIQDIYVCVHKYSN